MTAPKITLKAVREGLGESKKRAFSVSDFVSEQELEELHEKHRLKRQKKRFDAVDSIVAEIIARFGWEAYKAWNSGEIDEDWMARMLNAERAREAGLLVQLEATVFGTVTGALSKKGKKNLTSVHNIIKNNQKMMKN